MGETSLPTVLDVCFIRSALLACFAYVVVFLLLLGFVVADGDVTKAVSSFGTESEAVRFFSLIENMFFELELVC